MNKMGADFQAVLHYDEHKRSVIFMQEINVKLLYPICQSDIEMGEKSTVIVACVMPLVE